MIHTHSEKRSSLRSLMNQLNLRSGSISLSENDSFITFWSKSAAISMTLTDLFLCRTIGGWDGSWLTLRWQWFSLVQVSWRGIQDSEKVSQRNVNEALHSKAFKGNQATLRWMYGQIIMHNSYTSCVHVLLIHSWWDFLLTYIARCVDF